MKEATMATEQRIGVVQWDTAKLVEEWGAAKGAVAHLRAIQGRIEMELRRRMDQDEATEIYHPDWEVKIEGGAPVYATDKLIAGLQEALPPELFETCYIPEVTPPPIPAHINMTKAKPLRRLGAEVAAAIDGAVLPPLPGKLRIQAKASGSGDSGVGGGGGHFSEYQNG
jgi:hypothetical protein